ncbi:MAG: DUF4292 domain-containing protein [Bacteroidales bacterium]
MHKRTPLLILFILAGLAMSTYSCKSWKKTREAPETVEMKKLKELVEISSGKGIDYEFMSAKLSGNARLNGNSFRFTATLRMQKDSVIWISVSPGFGFEIARLLITPDSIKMVNRIEQSYIREEYSKIYGLLGIEVPFSGFQNLFTGNMPDISPDYSWETDTIDNVHIIRQKSREHSDKPYQKPVIQEYRIDPQNYMLRKIRIEQLSPTYRLLTFEYSDFHPLESQLYPKTIEGKLHDQSRNQFNFTYKSLSLKKDQNFPFHINAKYKKVSLKNNEP